MQAEAVRASESCGCLGGAPPLGLDFDSVPEAQDPLTGAGARRGPALDCRGEQLRQERIFFGKPVRFVSEPTPFDDPSDAANHAVQHSIVGQAVAQTER